MCLPLRQVNFLYLAINIDIFICLFDFAPVNLYNVGMLLNAASGRRENTNCYGAVTSLVRIGYHESQTR